MTDFSASIVPIVVPTLADSTANSLATFQATLTKNIVDTGNSLLQNYIALKDTNFYAVGDIPALGPQLLLIDLDNLALMKSKVTKSQPATDWTTLENKLDQLAALASPAAPALITTSVDVPSLDATTPVITLPSAPSADVGAPPGAAPNVTDPTFPDAPTLVIPAVPTFDELQLPGTPTFQLPSWTAVAPQNLLNPPTAQFSYVDPTYVSPLQDALVIKLLADLQNGTYGIDSSIEDALWGRVRDRAAQQAKQAVEEAVRRMASTSFPMPQGSMLEAIDQAEQKSQEILSEANRDISIKRADMYVEGRKFTIQQVKEFEKIRMDLYSATQERALNYSKAVVEMGIHVYEATVKNYQAQLEGYKAEASVFETRVRGELAKAELFRAQIEAEKTRVEFNRAKLDLFNGQLAAINTTVELYKSRLQAANIFMQVQAQRVDMFRSQVQAYAERVKAKEAEYNIYQAQIRGELSKLDVFKAQIEAYNARIGGLETKARIAIQNNQMLVQSFDVASKNYGNLLAQFEKQINGRLDEAKAKATYYGLDVDTYRAYTAAAGESMRVQSEMNRYNLDWNKASLAARVAQVEFRLKQLGLSVELQKDVNSHGVDFLRAALGGAVSGLNALGVSSTTT